MEKNGSTNENDITKLGQAIDLVRAKICSERKRLKDIRDTEEQTPILIEGETTTGHYCQMMVDPAEVARFLIEYDYPLYAVLGEDAPDTMWEELGYHFGLDAVSSVDL